MRMLEPEERRILELSVVNPGERRCTLEEELIARRLIRQGRADLVNDGTGFIRNHWGWKALRVDDIIRSLGM